MRPIDADALLKVLEREEEYNKDIPECANGIRYAIIDVLNAPSVEPERKKGRWITTPYPGNDQVTNYKCPLCKTGFSYVKCTEARPNFCINCGSDMRS